MFCSNCGKSNEDGSKFCVFCGHELQKKRRIFPIAFIIVGSILVIFILLFLLGKNRLSSQRKGIASETTQLYSNGTITAAEDSDNTIPNDFEINSAEKLENTTTISVDYLTLPIDGYYISDEQEISLEIDEYDVTLYYDQVEYTGFVELDSEEDDYQSYFLDMNQEKYFPEIGGYTSRFILEVYHASYQLACWVNYQSGSFCYKFLTALIPCDETSFQSNTGFNKSNGETAFDDYDEIVSSGDGYYFCKKTIEDFSSSNVYYGVYDTNNNTWAIPYEIDSDINTESILTNDTAIDDSVYYASEGVFIYLKPYSGDYVFVFSKSGEVSQIDLSVDVKRQLDYFKFEGGYFWGKINYNDGTSKYCAISSTGEIIDTGLSDYNYSGIITEYDSDGNLGFAVKFDWFELHVLIYRYSDNSIIELEQKYADAVTDDTEFNITENGITIRYLLGADGQQYYAEFDKQGNVITDTTLM